MGVQVRSENGRLFASLSALPTLATPLQEAPLDLQMLPSIAASTDWLAVGLLTGTCGGGERIWGNPEIVAMYQQEEPLWKNQVTLSTSMEMHLP